MSRIYVFDHPLIQHKTALLRLKETTTKDFRDLAKEIGMLMGYEATRDLPLKKVHVETPMCNTDVNLLDGHVGLYRDPETHKPVEYYCKMPHDIEKRKIFVMDPMLATGGSAVDAVSLVKEKGGKDITFMCLIAAPEGIETLSKAHPDIDILIAAKDEKLDENAYILPGLGDAGDRLYGTK